LQKAGEELQSKVQQSQTHNADTLAKIKQQRAEIDQLLGGLQHAIADIEGSVNAMQANKQMDLEELRNDAWQMEQELAATK
jgi:ABC-type transporter Mla subunit MlaD